MISSVATAAAAEKLAQERRRRQLQLLGDGGQEKPAPSSSSEESLLDAHGEEETIPDMVETLEAGAQLPAGATCDGVPNVPDSNSVAEQQQPADRAPATLTAGKQSKKVLQQSPEPVPAPGAAGRPQQQDPAAAQRRAPVTAAPTNTVARLVDAVLQLTNERFGASLRVQLKLADEVVQGVAEAVDESERGDTSVTLSLARTTRLSTAISAEYMFRPAVSPKFGEQVENVYKFDLMEDNPNWKTFLTSSTDLKAQAWEARRQAASNPLRKALSSKHRAWIYMTLSYPDHSRLAYWVGVFVICIILLNTITFCIESVPHYAGTPVYNSLTIVDYVCMGIFTAEYFLRLLCCPDLCRFLRSFSNLIDVVAILPFYVELCVKGTSNESEAFQTRVVRLLRVFRVLRIVKTMPKLRHLTLVSETLRDSVEVLIMLACLLLVLLVVFGTIIFFVEPSTFDSIPQAMYYAQTTLTTTGYGDIYPVTPWGRFVAGAAMLFCMVVVSLPIAVIGGNFSEKWTDYKSFKAAVDRSSRVHPTARALRSELERYEGVLDDVMKRLQECEVASEKQLRGVREELAAARAALLRGGAAAAGPGGPPGAASAELTLAPAPSGAAGLLSIVKIAARRARDNSSATRGTGGNGYGMPAAVESLQGSVASLVDLAEGSGGSFAGANGLPESSASGLVSPRHQAELRSAAALTARNGPQPLSAEAEEGTGAAKGLGSGFRAVVARVMKDHARASGPAADGDVTVSERQGSGGGSGNFGGAPHANAAGNSFAAATTAAEAALASTDGPSKATDASRNAAVVAASAPPPQPSPSADAEDEDFALQLPLPPPPPPPAAPPPPPPPPRPHGAYSQPSLAAAPASASLSIGGLALHFTNSISSILGRRGGGAAAAAATAAADDSAAAATPPLPMDPVALDFATVKLAHAGAGCKRARDLRVRHETLAAQAQILRSGDMPSKLEKLDEQYRLVRCWQDELGPMAERMWGLRDALDQLAWALQEGLPEERCSYEPADKAARAAADEALGVMRRRPAVGGEEGGSMREGTAGTPGAGEAARRDGAAAVVLSLK